MSDTDKQKLENNSGNYINQNHPDPSQDDTGTTKTALSNADESGNNLSSSVRPESHNSQKSPVLIIEHHNNIQGDRISETKSTKSDKKEEQTHSFNRKDIANKKGEANLQNAGEKTPDKSDNLNASQHQPNGQNETDNGKKQSQTDQNTNSDLSKNSEKNDETCSDDDICSSDSLQQGQPASTNLSLPNSKEHLAFIKGAMIEEADDMCEKFRDQGIQCGEDQVNKDRYIPKVLHKLCYITLPHIFAAFSLAVALYTQFITIPNLKLPTPFKIDPDKYQIQHILERLDSVSASIKETMGSIKHIEERLKSQAVVYKDDIARLENLFERNEQSLMHQISEFENLKNQFQKFEEEVAMKYDDISVIKSKQNELKTNFVTLEEKLEKQSKDVEKNNAEVAKEISQHKEDVRTLNLSVENLGSNMKLLTENITGISIETLVLEKRTDDIKENTFDKGSLITVIMIMTVLLVVIIIYLVAKKDNRHFIWNVDSIDQEANDGVNNSPAPYSTAGRILSQVRANPRLERKLCVISFYEETHPLHMQMTQSVTDVLTIQRVEFVIRRHEDILNIPPVCLLFLFVDFNERNVILEDPTLGLGDLRLTTVQAVQKMGGRLVIFYVRDQNSRQLGDMKLYNEDLMSVTRQRELSDLNRHSHFVSAYETLTDFQKTHLERIVRNYLNVS